MTFYFSPYENCNIFGFESCLRNVQPNGPINKRLKILSIYLLSNDKIKWSPLLVVSRQKKDDYKRRHIACNDITRNVPA